MEIIDFWHICIVWKFCYETDRTKSKIFVNFTKHWYRLCSTSYIFFTKGRWFVIVVVPCIVWCYVPTIVVKHWASVQGVVFKFQTDENWLFNFRNIWLFLLLSYYHMAHNLGVRHRQSNCHNVLVYILRENTHNKWSKILAYLQGVGAHRYGLFTLTETDSGTDSDSDSQLNSYIVHCRTC